MNSVKILSEKDKKIQREYKATHGGHQKIEKEIKEKKIEDN